MNNKKLPSLNNLAFTLSLFALLVSMSASLSAQNFDFRKLEETLQNYTVIVDMKIEFSFGTQSSEQEQRLLGTIVTSDGLVIFDGSGLDLDHPFASLSGLSFRADPTRINVTTLDEQSYDGEYLGVDRFTRIGFLRIQGADSDEFTPVKFAENPRFEVGSWVALYMLLPEFVDPPLAADVGMLSAIIETPETFPLTIGFSEFQLASVVFTEDLRSVGVLGRLLDPSSPRTDAGGFLESMGGYELPMLGVITGERLDKLIADPPKKGEIDRAWLGITLQALTTDISEFLGIEVPGGIIVNNIIKDSPADKAGLEIGDVIYEVNGRQVEVDREEKIPIFQRTIAEMDAGTSVEFSVARPVDDGVKQMKLVTVLEKAPIAAADAPDYESEYLEFKVRNLVFADYLFHNLDEETLSGVVVSELKQGGLASVGGLQIGDIIQRVDNTPVKSVQDMETLFERIEQEQAPEVIFFVWRNNKTMFINIKTDW
jgi:serine protease Do